MDICKLEGMALKSAMVRESRIRFRETVTDPVRCTCRQSASVQVPSGGPTFFVLVVFFAFFFSWSLVPWSAGPLVHWSPGLLVAWSPGLTPRLLQAVQTFFKADERLKPIRPLFQSI